MNKKFAWELFKNTGNLDAFMIMKDIENGMSVYDQNTENVLGGINGAFKDERNSNKNC